MNKSFFSSREIYVRLASLYKHKMAEYDPYTIMRWCTEVITDFITDDSGMIDKIAELGIPVNNMLPIPIGLFKLEYVFITGSNTKISYSHQGDYLLFAEQYSNTNISCYYHSFVFDDDGFPLIKRGYEKACEAHCIYNMYQEDFMEGKIDINRWKNIEYTNDWEIEAAARSWSEVNDSFVKDVLDAATNVAYKRK